MSFESSDVASTRSRGTSSGAVSAHDGSAKECGVGTTIFVSGDRLPYTVRGYRGNHEFGQTTPESGDNRPRRPRQVHARRSTAVRDGVDSGARNRAAQTGSRGEGQ